MTRALLVILLCVCIGVPALGADPAAPIVAVVGDVQQLMAGVGAFMKVVEPSTTPDDTAEIGAQIGDPGFEGFEAGKGFAIALGELEGPTVAVVAEVTEERADIYRGLFQAFGLESTAEGTVLVARSPGVAVDGALVAAARAALSGERRGRLDVEVAMAPLSAKYGPRLELMLGSIGAILGAGAVGEAEARAAEAELRVLLALARQVDRLSLTVEIDADSVRVVPGVAPLDGTRLASFVAALDAPANPTLLDRIPTGGALRVLASCAPAALEALLLGELDTALTTMRVAEATRASLGETAKQMIRSHGTGFALDLYRPASLLSGGMVIEGATAEVVLASYEQLTGLLADEAVKDFIDPAKQSWKTGLTRDARRVGDVSVHRYTLGLESSSLPPDVQQALGVFGDGLEVELAEVEPGTLVGSLGSVDIATLIAGGTGGGLRALEVRGPGGVFYADVDLGRLMVATLSALPRELRGPISPAVMDALSQTAGHPITLGVSREGRSLRGGLRLPASLPAVIAQGVRAETALAQDRNRRLRVMADFRMLQDACSMHKLDYRKWPESCADLVAEAYIREAPLDPWTGKPYIWLKTDRGPVFISHGADGVEGGTGDDADIRSDR